jgi:hypothetical protein
MLNSNIDFFNIVFYIDFSVAIKLNNNFFRIFFFALVKTTFMYLVSRFFCIFFRNDNFFRLADYTNSIVMFVELLLDLLSITRTYNSNASRL